VAVLLFASNAVTRKWTRFQGLGGTCRYGEVCGRSGIDRDRARRARNRTSHRVGSRDCLIAGGQQRKRECSYAVHQVEFAGRIAEASLLVKCTVPAYAAAVLLVASRAVTVKLNALPAVSGEPANTVNG